MSRNSRIVVLLLLLTVPLAAQQVPSAQENIPYLVTFGQNSDHSRGDDDFSQTIFFSIPRNQQSPFYIRIFDPETGGTLDENNAGWNTRMQYSIFGGKDAYYNKDARGINPVGNYKSGVLLETRTFASESTTDGKWISFGPFNPLEGELVQEFDAYVFKVVVDGQKGNDGNLYKMFFSTEAQSNVAVEGGSAFAYEYSVRFISSSGAVAHLYPFADSLVSGLKIRSFDFDDDGQLKLYSAMKNGHLVTGSGDNSWTTSVHNIVAEERNRSLDIQIVKRGDFVNDVVFYVTNQQDVPVPLFAIPRGGIPKYRYSVRIHPTATGRSK